MRLDLRQDTLMKKLVVSGGGELVECLGRVLVVAVIYIDPATDGEAGTRKH